VLLACLTVEDCKVTEICNLERKFVLTGPNLRYWYPGICRIGEELEKLCCPPCRPDRTDTFESGETAEPRTWEDHLRAALGRGPAYGQMAVSAILESRDRGPLEFLGSFIAGERENLARREHQSAAAAAELHQRLEAALVEVQELKREQGKLLERMAKVEKRKNPEEK